MSLLIKRRPKQFVADAATRKGDPTGTGKIRRGWEGEAIQRINTAGRKIKAAIVEHDVLGLKKDAMPTGVFSVGTPATKAQLFGEWVYQTLKGELLSTQWQNKYARKAFVKGQTDAALAIKRAGHTFKPTFIQDAYIPNEDRAAIIYLKSYTELEGVTDAMASQMQSIIAGGLAEGKSPMQIARDLDRTLEIGRTRARVIARTETIGAHAEASLNTYEEAGIDEVIAEVEFTTAGDDHVCPQCQGLEGERYSIEDARGVIPVHPQCRCSWQPVPKSERSVGNDLRSVGDIWNPFQPRVPKGDPEGGQWTAEGGGGGGGGGGSLSTPKATKFTQEHAATLRQYAGADYYPINRGLRSGNKLSDMEERTVAKLDEAFRLLPKTSDIKLLFRAAGPELDSAMNGVNVGDVITDNAFVSTTEDEYFARKLLGGGMGHTSIMEIVVPKNAAAIDMKTYNALKEENEVLLPRGSTFKYLGKEGDKYRFRYNQPAYLGDSWQDQEREPAGSSEGGQWVSEQATRVAMSRLARKDREFSDQEARAIRMYARQHYAGLNRMLRYDLPPKEWQTEMRDMLDAAFSKSILEHAQTVWRGMGENLDQIMKDMKPGDVLENPAYTSTSPDSRTAGMFSGFKSPLMEISLPGGVNAINVHEISEAEPEILLPRGSKLTYLGRGAATRKNGPPSYRFELTPGGAL